VSTAGGAGALAGVVNMRTLDVEDILEAGSELRWNFEADLGSNGQGFSEMGAAAAAVGGISVAGAVSHKDPDSYENASGVVIPRTFQDLTSGLFKVNLAPDSEQSLALAAFSTTMTSSPTRTSRTFRRKLTLPSMPSIRSGTI
jgi:hemoglobin/transferrin/lactoferrin receptor protein